MFTKQYYPQYQIGKGTYGQPKIFSWGEKATLTIGAYCSISAGVNIFLGGEHRPDWVSTYPFNVLNEKAKHITGHPRTKGDVVIGNDVWIAMGVVILSGVTIGDGAVIGCSALVTKDVPPYTIVGGNPAKVIRKRFDDNTIERLLEIKWWAWEDQAIEAAIPFLLNDDIEAFIRYAKQNGKL